MGSKKVKKDSKAKVAVRTSPWKQKASRDADPDEDSQEQSQEPSDEPERREALLEGDEAKGPEGDGDGLSEMVFRTISVWCHVSSVCPTSCRIISSL